jgi:predicted RNase H-like nuclease (RuvC/YqgF family)
MVDKKGPLERIADACELMAKNNAELKEMLDHMRDSRNHWQEKCQRMERSMNTMKGVNTKLRNKLRQLEAPQIGEQL